MIGEYIDWLFQIIDWDILYYSLLAGIFFGFYVFYKGEEESSWRDIVGWGVAVWLTYISIGSLHRLVEGNPAFWSHFHATLFSWGGFIFSIVVTAGILRWFVKHSRTWRDRLS